MDDDWELRWVHVPEGTHLSNSRATPGRDSDLLREDGTNKNLGPAESVAADGEALFAVPSDSSGSPNRPGGPEPTWVQQLAVDVITDIAKAIDWEAVFEQFVAPAIKRQSTKVRERVRSAIGRIRRRPRADTAALPSGAPTVILETSEDGTGVGMSSAEYRERVVSALAAEAYAAWQRGMLANARVEDDLDPELVRAVELMLRGNLISMDEQTLLAVMEFLDGSRPADRVPALSWGENHSEPLARPAVNTPEPP